jgi:hypothetical protein
LCPATPGADAAAIEVLLFRHVQEQSEVVRLIEVATIQWWLDHGMPYSRERMGGIYFEWIAGPTGEVFH